MAPDCSTWHPGPLPEGGPKPEEPLPGPGRDERSPPKHSGVQRGASPILGFQATCLQAPKAPLCGHLFLSRAPGATMVVSDTDCCNLCWTARGPRNLRRFIRGCAAGRDRPAGRAARADCRGAGRIRVARGVKPHLAWHPYQGWGVLAHRPAGSSCPPKLLGAPLVCAPQNSLDL